MFLNVEIYCTLHDCIKMYNNKKKSVGTVHLSWTTIVKSIKLMSDDGELDKISKVLEVNTPETVRLMNEDKSLNLAAATAVYIPIPCSPIVKNIYHTTVLVNYCSL